MNANEKIVVKSFYAYCVEDDYNQGEIGDWTSQWSDRDIAVDGAFDSVVDALKAICKANCFDYKPDSWTNWFKEYGDEMGRFDFSALVDVNNCEASKSQMEQWKNGDLKLYACSMSAYLTVQAERDLNIAECNI